MSDVKLLDIPMEKYEDAIVTLLTKCDVPYTDAKIAVKSFADADQTGVYTHGIFRLPHYLNQLKNQDINPKPTFTWLGEGRLIYKMDADHALGSVAAHYAMEKAISLAKEKGTGVVTVRKSNHFGTAAFYSELASKQGMISIVLSTSSKSIAPTGSKTPLLGNNPWSVSLPTFDGPPITLDMANSVVARGKIRVAASKGEKIPYGWALDSNGKPTNDPVEAIKGIVLPVGEHKGYGISLLIEIIAGILAGAAFGENKVDLDEDGKRDVGHLMFAMPIEHWLPIEQYKHHLDELIKSIKNAEKIDGIDEIYLPGEIEALKREEQSNQFVRIPQRTWEMIRTHLEAEANIKK
ncbi:Ldh family oxidoreductase [Salirhabdus salicampi]|uniref:Ldh family oxidoreductase n=1 Tax=Salirhabdus salicampi TaxID=476102 RepID=UPI0020C40840|nr:Ldh family oxidoreductase [Salirhabdus salicampi]MCP8615918.1 Ldh family oxidoreductase [Salirhabdus salicampi]